MLWSQTGMVWDKKEYRTALWHCSAAALDNSIGTKTKTQINTDNSSLSWHEIGSRVSRVRCWTFFRVKFSRHFYLGNFFRFPKYSEVLIFTSGNVSCVGFGGQNWLKARVCRRRPLLASFHLDSRFPKSFVEIFEITGFFENRFFFRFRFVGGDSRRNPIFGRFWKMFLEFSCSIKMSTFALLSIPGGYDLLLELGGRKSQRLCGFPDYLPVFLVLNATTLMSATSRKQAPKNCSMERYRCGRTAISEWAASG